MLFELWLHQSTATNSRQTSPMDGISISERYLIPNISVSFARVSKCIYRICIIDGVDVFRAMMFDISSSKRKAITTMHSQSKWKMFENGGTCCSCRLWSFQHASCQNLKLWSLSFKQNVNSIDISVDYSKKRWTSETVRSCGKVLPREMQKNIGKCSY